ncbi:hypothetical protein [Amycolatopsis nigrescens]|uniref:hypothetical protein n=1 Tax=Amycolatopsis nigrescens TaxID=381445 RepID=UPI00036280ED|nr:hypothetical protein [Amycolatopsis nigrescens]
MPTSAEDDHNPGHGAFGPDPRDFVRQGPPTNTQPARFGRARIGRRVLFSRPGRRRHQLKLWSAALVAAAALAGILGAIFGYSVVVIVISAAVGLVIGGFGHTEADLLFRITDRGINLGVAGGSFRWADITSLTLVTMPCEGAEYVGPSGNVNTQCPRCGKKGFRASAALELHGADGGTVAQLNMAYVTAPGTIHCLACLVRKQDANVVGPYARRRIAPPVGLAFLDEGWDRFSELVTDVAPHVKLIKHSPRT